MGHENKGNNNKLKDFSIVKQILLSSTLGNVWRSVWRICKLMLGCKELSYSSTEQDHVKSVRLRQMVADILCTLLLTKSQQISYQRKACNSASPRKISVFQFWYKWQLTFPSETLTVPIVWIVPDQHKPRSFLQGNDSFKKDQKNILPAKQGAVYHQIQLPFGKPRGPGRAGPVLMHIFQRRPRRCNWFCQPSKRPVKKVSLK